MGNDEEDSAAEDRRAWTRWQQAGGTDLKELEILWVGRRVTEWSEEPGLYVDLAPRQKQRRVRHRPSEWQGNSPAVEELWERWFGRMWDLSAFMKVLKQRFSQWFNGCHARRGTLWEDRFRSVLVEGKGQALRAMAAGC